MDKKTLTVVGVVVLGIILGVIISVNQSKQPLLEELVKQQGQILQSQAKLEKKLVSDETSGSSSKQADLERRVVMLEAQIKAMQILMLQGQGVQGRQQAQQQPPPEEDFSKVYDLKTNDSPMRGPKNAPVTITEFVDFQCPFCARFHPPLLEVFKNYPDKVNYVIKNYPLPFHPNARPAAKAVFAAGEQGKYFEMADAILKDNSNLSEDRYKSLAKDLGLNVDKFMKDYKDKDAEWEKRIQADMELAEKSDFRGTPTFYINGKKTMARDFAGYKKEIDQILAGTK